MPIVWIPALLRDMTGGEAAVTIPGATVWQVIEQLDERYPGIKGRLCQGDRLRPNLAVVIDGEVRRSGLHQQLTETSEVFFLPALSGGVIEMWSDEASMQAEWRKIDNRTWIVDGEARGKATVTGAGPYTVRVELPDGHAYDAPFEFGELPAALEWAVQEVAPEMRDLGVDSG